MDRYVLGCMAVIAGCFLVTAYFVGGWGAVQAFCVGAVVAWLTRDWRWGRRE